MDDLQLGGNIELSGFSSVDPKSMIILKKMVGNYAKKFSDQCEQFEKLKVTLKNVHQSEDHPGRFELHGKVVDKGRSYTSEVVDTNLFVTLDKAMKKIEASMAR